MSEVIEIFLFCLFCFDEINEKEIEVKLKEDSRSFLCQFAGRSEEAAPIIGDR